jgi:beta-phosphoglucomutase
METRGVIYDLDGVIVDTAKFHYKGWKKLADELGVPFDETKNEKLKGVSRRDSLLALLGRNPGEEKIREWCDRKNGYYLEFVSGIDRGEMLPGALERLEEVRRNKGWKQALASSSKNARLILEKLDIEKYFDAVVDGNETEKTKPDPELFLRAAAKMGLPADKILVFEDAESGVRAAKNGGMLAVGLGDKNILKQADRVIRNLSEIDLAGIEGLFRNGSGSRNGGKAEMTGKDWLIEDTGYDPERELYWETIYALSNGYMAARGSLEENHFVPEIRSYFGTYVAGVFDKYNKDYQAIVNLPDFFNTAVYINGELMCMTQGRVESYERRLDMRRGLLMRRMVWVNSKAERTQVEVTRFISKADPHLAVLHYRLKPLNYTGDVRIVSVLDGNVTNIDFHVSGYQLRDEKYYFIADEHEAEGSGDGGFLTVRTKTTQHAVCEAVRFRLEEDGAAASPRLKHETRPRVVESRVEFRAAEGREYSFCKTVGVYTSNDPDKPADLKAAAAAKAAGALEKGFHRLLEEHAREWDRLWEVADCKITGDARDQRNVRFNIYHLIQMGNKDNPRVNVGSRGLTSEMHYGNCFWDTELFIMPFFIYTDPAAARALVEYRHLTLPAAREKAKKLLFKGALYPWMSSWPGREQADYWEYANIAVHIVSDVIFGLMNYYNATGDEKFMLDSGLEMLVETSRFWESRVTWSPVRKKYVMNVVKGPNEYAITNNNTYTNWGCRWSLRSTLAMLAWAKRKFPREYARAAKKLKLGPREPAAWKKIADNLFINYDKKRDLYIEDDTILEKTPIERTRLKPGGVKGTITTELGYTWDTFLRLQIVKQADVLLLMYIHRPQFTRRQLANAWKFYEPMTLHDSSLSYNTHCIVANELGDVKRSDDYFQMTARLDLEDVMKNVFLGIHSANAGGTWQCVVNGFCGMRMGENYLEFNPNLPSRYKKVEFKVFYRGNLFNIEAERKNVRITLERETGQKVRILKNRILPA